MIFPARRIQGMMRDHFPALANQQMQTARSGNVSDVLFSRFARDKLILLRNKMDLIVNAINNRIFIIHGAYRP
jgi:hypothetical protein